MPKHILLFFRKSDNGLLLGLDECVYGKSYDPSFIQIEQILTIENPEAISDDDIKSIGTKRRKPLGSTQKCGLIFEAISDPMGKYINCGFLSRCVRYRPYSWFMLWF